MAVNSEVEIANMALDLVKEAPINSFQDDRAPARWMDRNYALYRDVVLTSHIWKFAMSRAILAEDTTKPDFGWITRYRKPADCLRVLPLRFQGTMNGMLIPHEVEGEWILTSTVGPLRIKFIRRVTNVSEYDGAPLFIQALAAKLAASMAFWMTGREKIVDFANVQFKEAITMAQYIDSAEGTEPEQYANAYDLPRHSGYGYGSSQEEGW